MFKNPSEAKLYERNVQQAVDGLLTALKGGEYKAAIAVLDWMKEAVAVNACITGPEENGFSCRNSPSFPIRYAMHKKYE
ncbi:TPA: hypothetical protein M5853_002470 [Klebsiella aerogenes]|uniref:hypothetical protein n=1 Tax=Klebsiella aerogenes TaxID=548 RepID=UPI003754DEFA|nr:hypothetical protein [Klebsiella aerogenes]